MRARRPRPVRSGIDNGEFLPCRYRLPNGCRLEPQPAVNGDRTLEHLIAVLNLRNQAALVNRRPDTARIGYLSRVCSEITFAGCSNATICWRPEHRQSAPGTTRHSPAPLVTGRSASSTALRESRGPRCPVPSPRRRCCALLQPDETRVVPTSGYHCAALCIVLAMRSPSCTMAC